MRLAVAYNIFDGTENLEASLKNIRPVTDLLIGVYQTVSNYGNVIEQDIPSLLQRLGFHYIIEYIPKLGQTPHYNEIAKRNIGLDIARQNGCNMFMTMDCDELYNLTQRTDGKAYKPYYALGSAFVLSGTIVKMTSYSNLSIDAQVK